MRILIAPNAFKNSCTAMEAASALREGLLQSRLQCSCECFPVGDGGDGTVDLLVHHCQGSFSATEVHNALGEPITAAMGWMDEGRTALIEMANAAGLRLLSPQQLQPMRSNAAGTGEQIKAALDAGATKIIIGMGGSATVDGGAGIAAALGLQLMDDKGAIMQAIPENFAALSAIDLSGLDKRLLKTTIIVLCDVSNPLLGPRGAATMFGPQKGANAQQVQLLEEGLGRWADIVQRHTGKDMRSVAYAGTAGGAAAGLWALLNARLVNGIDYFLSLTQFDAALQKTDLVITGEGSIDEQTLQGKAPFGVSKRAREAGLPVVGIAGQVPLQPGVSLQECFTVLLSIGNAPMPLPDALATTRNNLVRTGQLLGNTLAITNSRNK
ncbi:MAG TPA: glycerate kinase [Chitinophagaceae bacterium]|nr:glycerate kinase [Chitinophagaceae bacterium]